MDVLFSTRNTPISWLILKITGEPVSHTAILYDGYVIQADWGGLQVCSLDKFKQTRTIVFQVTVNTPPERILAKLLLHYGCGYDYTGLLWLGVQRLLDKVGINITKNLWSSTRACMCTEWTTDVVENQEDSEITPYQLYLKLKAGGR